MATNQNVVKHDEMKLSQQLQRRGVDEVQWRALRDSIFPGAQNQSILMVIDYCKARGLDPLKRPCHIVPMRKNVNGQWVDVDQVLPGIYELRTTAHRTGEYMGHDLPEFGDSVEYLGVTAPEWCLFTVRRWNKKANQVAEYPVTVWFTEAVATFMDRKDNGREKVNSRWTKAPRQMLTKCAEAASLREAFPEALGGMMSAEEMEGHELLDDPIPVHTRPQTPPETNDDDVIDVEIVENEKPIEQATVDASDVVDHTDTGPTSETVETVTNGKPDMTLDQCMKALADANTVDKIDEVADLIREFPQNFRNLLEPMYKNKRQRLADEAESIEIE